MATILPQIALAVLAYMTALFLLAWAIEDNSIVDIGWGPGFVLVAWLSLLLGAGPLARPLLVTCLVTVWGLRLAIHIFLRSRGRGEDFRYAAWRAQWGRWLRIRSFFQVFMLQGALMLVVALEVIAVNARSSAGLGWLDLMGVVVWGTGFFFQALGDAQLYRFTRDPANRGRVLDSGLWRYTRHPNYFGESVMWWGIFLMTVQVPGGWLTVISPALITFLLLRVSGVTMLEKGMEDRRPGYSAYVRRTSAFWPMTPRRRG